MIRAEGYEPEMESDGQGKVSGTHHTEGYCAVDEAEDEEYSKHCASEAVEPEGAIPALLLL